MDFDIVSLSDTSCTQYNSTIENNNLCDGQKCTEFEACQSTCCLGYGKDHDPFGICYNINNRPCEQLPNGDICVYKDECQSGICTAGKCIEASVDKLIVLAGVGIVAIIVIVMTIVICIMKYRKEQRYKSEASKHY